VKNSVLGLLCCRKTARRRAGDTRERASWVFAYVALSMYVCVSGYQDLGAERPERGADV